MLGRWYQIEVDQKFKALGARIDSLLERWAKDQMDAAEQVRILRGEITALKMRMGKQKEKATHDGAGTT